METFLAVTNHLWNAYTYTQIFIHIHIDAASYFAENCDGPAMLVLMTGRLHDIACEQ
jgi:hypothetical protein